MPKTTHAELVFHTLRYVTETLAEGDIHAVLDLGFRVDQIALLERLTLRDLYHLSQVRTHFMDVAVNPACFDRILDYVTHNQLHFDVQDELIRLRAPIEMMRALFGMSNGEYATRRQVLGLTGIGVGRPTAPSEDDEMRIWDAWQSNAQYPPEQRYLQVGRSTGVPLNTVWASIRALEAVEPYSAHRFDDDPKVISLRRNH